VTDEREAGDADKVQPGEQQGAAKAIEEGDAPATSVDVDDDGLGELAEGQWAQQSQQLNTFITNIYDGVHSDRVHIGVAASSGRRRVTGTLDAAEIEAAARFYLRPAPFDEASRLLADRRLVVLAGAEGIGRRAGALALLTTVTGVDTDVTSLPPSLNTGDLAARTYRSGRGYLVQDLIVDREAPAVRRFELDQLLAVLKASDAYLVITVTPASAAQGAMRDLRIDWQVPDPLSLFEHCLDENGPAVQHDADVELVRRRAAELTRPRDIVALAARLRDGVDAAMAALEDTERERVRAWFDDKPNLHQVLTIAALAFINDIPQATFERCLARLVAIEEDRSGRESQPTEGDPQLPQSRRLWAAEDSLAKIVRDDSTGGLRSPRRLVFTASGYRTHVLAELVDRYGYELWDPLVAWAAEVAAESDLDVQLELGLGIAMLAGAALHEVTESFIEPWANGTPAQRLTVAQTVSWMCLDDALAAEALGMVVGWVKHGSPRRAVTATIALSGELGVRYWSDALRMLWELVLRGGPVGTVAAKALAIRYSSASAEAAEAARVLSQIASAIEWSMRRERREARLQRVLGAALELIRAEQFEARQPMAAFVLQSAPELAPTLGRLFGEVLRSASRQVPAIDALVATLRALGGDESVRPAVEEFGGSVRDCLSDREWSLLRPQLQQALDGTDQAALVAALLRVLDRSNNGK